MSQTPTIVPDARTTGEERLLRSKARRDQLLASVIGIVLLGAAMALQSVLSGQRAKMIDEPPTSLRTLAINFPRLTLGGFRGILAAVLWQQAEDDKEARKWMDLETKYDIIGAIEPYFVSVYVFHSWNQAYNLSAQWHDDDSKYKWVLDGLGYLYKGEQYNPDNPDLILEEGNLFFLKLGGAFERIFYRAHWRSDIARMHELDTKSPNTTADATEALRLVRSYVLRNEFHTKEFVNESGVPGYGVTITDAWLFDKRADGKNPGEPMEFRYGLSPFYFGYVEFKRSLAAGTATTIGPQVADAWPAMCLRLWCRDDLYYSSQTMKQMFSQAPDNPEVNEFDPANPAFNAKLFSEKVLELRDCYRNVDMIAPKAVEAFNADLAAYPTNRGVHVKHIDETESYRAIGQAERKLLDALVIWHNNGRAMSDAVKKPFLDALPVYDNAIKVTYNWVDRMYPPIPMANNQGTYVNPDRADFERYVSALKIRKAGIENMLKTPPTEKPDMSFLQEEVVER